MTHRIDRLWMRRVVVASLWLVVVLLWRHHQTRSGLGTLETAQRFVDQVDARWWGPLAFLIVYLVRPLLLFPASVMTVAAGVLFGPLAGISIVVVAANASAMLAYAVGRSLARAGTPADGSGDDGAAGLVTRWGQRLRDRSFETVFVMRLLFVPYDLVNYACGALRIGWRSFLLATALGTLPGTVSFVLLGASLERIDDGLGGIDPVTVGASVALFGASLVVARGVRRRHLPSGPTTGVVDPRDATSLDDRHHVLEHHHG